MSVKTNIIVFTSKVLLNCYIYEITAYCSSFPFTYLMNVIHNYLAHSVLLDNPVANDIKENKNNFSIIIVSEH